MPMGPVYRCWNVSSADRLELPNGHVCYSIFPNVHHTPASDEITEKIRDTLTTHYANETKESQIVQEADEHICSCLQVQRAFPSDSR